MGTMKSMKTRKTMMVGGLAVALLAGCGSSDSASDTSTESSIDSSSTSPLETAGTADGSFNDADVMFAQMMIPHHEQAIEMSDIALDPQVGASEVVGNLAMRIKGAQDPEIDLMTSFLQTWGQPVAMDSSMDHSTMMSGMLSIEDLDALSMARGEEFDRAWLAAMIEHHEGAIDMARDVLADGSNVDVRALAEQIIAAQQTEIDEMTALLG
jgi:uncharacterized protein (DUF305 family)